MLSGPKGAARLVRLLLERKVDVLGALAAESSPAGPPEAAVPAAPVPAIAVPGPPPVDPERLRQIRERFAALAVDDHARQERAAIVEFDGGLTREAAEHRAGLR
jgi:hypothetical protein